MISRTFVVVVATVLALASCADGGDPSGPAPSTSRATPGDPTTTWAATMPTEPVDAATVAETYDRVLDAAEASHTIPPDLEWSSSTIRTEELEGVCAVTLERSAVGAVPAPGDDTLDLTGLTDALAAHGFDDLAMADDPGGAVRYLAHDAAGALFELRSQDASTLAVRVPTTASSCG